MAVTSILCTSCFKDINEALSKKAAMGTNNFLDFLRQEAKEQSDAWEAYRKQFPKDFEDECRERFLKEHAESHKYVVLRDKATGVLTFFFVLNYPDRDVGSLAMYAGVVCTSDQYRAVDGPGQLDQALAAIMTADAARRQFDWIGYGHFWLNKFDGKDQLGLDYNYPALDRESEPYWHEGLSEVVRDSLANLFGIYVAMYFTLRRQSAPRAMNSEVKA